MVRIAETEALLVETVRAVSANTVGKEVSFMDAGIDSLGLVELQNTLQPRLGGGVNLGTTVFFD